jgi:hypothetical protein
MSGIKLTLKQRIQAEELHEKMVENQTYEEAAYELIFLQDELSRLRDELEKANRILKCDAMSCRYVGEAGRLHDENGRLKEELENADAIVNLKAGKK